MKTDAILSVEDFIQKAQAGKFVIPPYQRGYKWGVPDADQEEAVGVLMGNLLDAFKQGKAEFFIQGVTVFEKDKDVYLIDGQQRTTTLYLLLGYLTGQPPFELHYTIRKDSNDFLQKQEKKGIFSFIQACRVLKAGEECPHYEQKDYQDIFYFQKAICTIHKQLVKNKFLQGQADGLKAFEKYVREKVKLFYVVIRESQASKTFRLLNGGKAIMLPQELIKAGFLSKASRVMGQGSITSERDQLSQEWEINALRSRYARQWDRWIYWWRRPEVKALYRNDDTPLGLLLPIYHQKEYPEKPTPQLTYKSFSDAFMKDAPKAKEQFGKLRKLQKRFEDWFHDTHTYNYLGLIMRVGGGTSAILYLLEEADKKSKEGFQESLKSYARWILLGISHKDIIGQDEEANQKRQSSALEMYRRLAQKHVYKKEDDDDKNAKEDAFRQLLRRNVEMDNEVGRRFDFSLYTKRSLEHIHPQSWENEEARRLKFDPEEKLSVDSIGNLVLLGGDDNAAFSNWDFEGKKAIYFGKEEPEKLKEKPLKWSLKLLHSVSIFSNSKWNAETIRQNQQTFLAELRHYYDPPEDTTDENTQPAQPQNP